MHTIMLYSRCLSLLSLLACLCSLAYGTGCSGGIKTITAKPTTTTVTVTPIAETRTIDRTVIFTLTTTLSCIPIAAAQAEEGGISAASLSRSFDTATRSESSPATLIARKTQCEPTENTTAEERTVTATPTSEETERKNCDYSQSYITVGPPRRKYALPDWRGALSPSISSFVITKTVVPKRIMACSTPDSRVD